jgi:hypothetical protein
MPGELLDARDDLPKRTPCQVTVSEVKSEVLGVPDEATARRKRALDAEVFERARS